MCFVHCWQTTLCLFKVRRGGWRTSSWTPCRGKWSGWARGEGTLSPRPSEPQLHPPGLSSEDTTAPPSAPPHRAVHLLISLLISTRRVRSLFLLMLPLTQGTNTKQTQPIPLLHTHTHTLFRHLYSRTPPHSPPPSPLRSEPGTLVTLSFLSSTALTGTRSHWTLQETLWKLEPVHPHTNHTPTRTTHVSLTHRLTLVLAVAASVVSSNILTMTFV